MAEETFVEVRGLNRLVNRFRRLEGGILSEQIMGEIATYVITMILQRTAIGVDAGGQNFKPYSPKYRLFREETGHQGTPVNLFYTGSMLSAMTYKTAKNYAEIFFMDTEDKYGGNNPQKAYYNQQNRNFFSVSVNEQEQIRNMVRDFIHNMLRE